MSESADTAASNSQIELQLSARSAESVEFEQKVANRKERLESLGHLQELAEMRIKQGVELANKSHKPDRDNNNESSEEEQESSRQNSFETEDLDSHHRPDGSIGDSDRTISTMPNTTSDDDEELGVALPSAKNRNKIVPPDWIGNIRCYWHDKAGVPRITIGPNWGFTIVLGFLVSGATYTSVKAMIEMIKLQAAWYYLVTGAFIIVFGLWCFFRTFLGDPGIPPAVYKMKARPYALRPALPPTDEEGFRLCTDCNIYVILDREHCDLCNVCIDNPDHHCVFYSKCIGAGNILWFRLSLGAFVINMSYFIVAYGIISVKAQKHKLL